MKLLVESLLIFVLTLGAAAVVVQGKPAFADVAVAHAAIAAPCVAGFWNDGSCDEADRSALSWISP